MPRWSALLLFVCVVVEGKPRMVSLANLPVVFEPNHGQAPASTLFLSRGIQYGLQLRAKSAVLSLPRDTISLEWVGANDAMDIAGDSETGGLSNYMSGEDSSRWKTSVPHYRRVRYRSLYPGIDLLFYGTGHQLEFDYIVAPGADPARIRLRTRGAHLRLASNGELLIEAPRGAIRLGKPTVFQLREDGSKQPVLSRFRLLGQEEVAFHLGPYDHSQALIIDPTLVSTYVGGRDADIAASVATDANSFIYLTGFTSSTNFSLSATPYKNSLTAGDGDAFVMKLDPETTQVLYSTFLGGNFTDYGQAIAADSTGAVYVTGTTIGRFPTTAGAFRELASNAPTIFVAKLSPNGSSLLYSTYLDGAGAGQGVAVDNGGNAYITGYTYSATFPTTTGAYQRMYTAATDAFVVKLNPTGTAQVYSTFLGGSGEDQGTAIRVDSTGAAYVSGFTSSSNFPVTTGAYRTSYSGATDAFVTKINTAGSALNYSTLLGGPNVDRAHALDINLAGEAFVAGQTYSSSFPTVAGSYRTTHGGGADAFVTRLNAAGSAAVYSTFLGGSGNCSVTDPFRYYQCDGAFGIAVDASNQAFVTGVAGTGFPMVAAQQSVPGGNGDAFLSQLNAAGSALLHSTYIGGGSGDVGLGIAYSNSGGPVAVGFTNSTDFPVNALQTTNGGGTQEGFLTRVGTCGVTLGSSHSFFPIQAGTYTLAVSSASSCAWVATVNQSWVTLNSSSGTGNGSVSYTVAANTGTARTANITVGSQTFTIDQVSGLCVTPATSSSWHPQAGGNFTLIIFATCSWTASSNVGWVTITSGSGTGNGQVLYNVAANNTGLTRTDGQIDIGGQKFSVYQVGGPPPLSCDYGLSRSADSFGAEGGSSSLLVTAATGCEWTTTSGASWISVTAGLAGNGEGVVGYTILRNTSGAARSGILAIGGRTLDITQH